MLVCCQVTFLILLCLFGGLLLGVWLAHDQEIAGLPDLWNKFVGIFQSKKST